jgi:hypothetical protein
MLLAITGAICGKCDDVKCVLMPSKFDRHRNLPVRDLEISFFALCGLNLQVKCF